MKAARNGFTYPELLVVMGLAAILITLSTVRLLGAQHKPQLSTSVDVMITDLRQQQQRAMSGDAPDGVLSDYGIYFEANRYTMFRGSSYVANDAYNAVVVPDSPVAFTNITLPGNTVVFARGSGEVVGFTAGADSFRIQHPTSGESKTLLLNRYGTVVSVN